MNRIEFLAVRKLQKEHKATDYETALFLDEVNAGDRSQEAALEIAMVEVADDSYWPEGAPAPSLAEVFGRPNGEPPKPSETDGSPGIYRGPFAGGHGSGEIGVRWAKETIGLVAVELNEAYAEFDIGRDGYEMPSGKLYGATERLKEAIQRLGITGDELTF